MIVYSFQFRPHGVFITTFGYVYFLLTIRRHRSHRSHRLKMILILGILPQIHMLRELHLIVMHAQLPIIISQMTNLVIHQRAGFLTDLAYRVHFPVLIGFASDGQSP